MQLNLQLIKQLRTERGWTQQQLADICTVSLRTIQRVEMQGVGSLETCKALAVAFAVPREQLLQGEVATPATAVDRSTPQLKLWVAAAFGLGIAAGSVMTWLLQP